MIRAAHDRVGARLTALAPSVLPSLARLVFAGTLLGYYWASARTKFGDGAAGLLRPADGAYAQIFPRAFEAAGYDVTQLGAGHMLVVLAGTWAEAVLPLLIVAGLLTRLAAAGMIGFVAVQSVVDVIGHGLGASDVGRWFDAMPSALILDQRSFWGFLLLSLVFLGAGPVSLDRLLRRGAGRLRTG